MGHLKRGEKSPPKQKGESMKKKLIVFVAYLALLVATISFIAANGGRTDKEQHEISYAKEETLVGPETTIETPQVTPTSTPTVTPTQKPRKNKPPKPPYLDVPLSKKLQKHIFKLCKNDKDLYLLTMAVIKAESDFDPDCIGIDGHDKGLMQIRDCNLDSLQERFGKIVLMDPYDNTKCGVYMIRQIKKKYKHNNLTLMAYNCGEAGARRLWKKGIYSTKYSRKITEYYNNFKKECRKEQ
jgi:soluble lytic murein transglycosylase-like protein